MGFLLNIFRDLWARFFPKPEVKEVEIPPPVTPTVTPPPVVVELPPTEPDPPQVDLPPLFVKTGSRFFHAGNVLHPSKVKDYREATAMGVYRLWLDGHYGKVEQFFTYLHNQGFSGIRVLLNLDSPFWHEKQRHNSYKEGTPFWNGLVPFIQYAKQFGLYTRLCLFGGVEPFGVTPDWRHRPDVVSGNVTAIDEMFSFMESAVSITKDETSVLYEVANEPAQIGFGSSSQVILDLGTELARYLAPDRLMNFGAATDENDVFYAQYPANFLDEHLARHEEWDYHASVKRLINHPGLDQVQMPFMSGEWMKLGLEGETLSTATAFASAAMLRLKHAIPAFHAKCFLWGDVPDAATDACVTSWHEGLNVVGGVDLPGGECNGHWDCSPWDKDIFPPTEEETDEWYGPVRIYGRVVGEQESGSYSYIGLSLREPRNYDLENFCDLTERGYGVETLHLEQWGDWQSRVVIVR